MDGPVTARVIFPGHLQFCRQVRLPIGEAESERHGHIDALEVKLNVEQMELPVLERTVPTYTMSIYSMTRKMDAHRFLSPCALNCLRPRILL